MTRGERRRARQACVACNQKRIKCNVTSESPCRNCARAGLHCEVRESRRGKHPRLKTPSQQVDANQDADAEPDGHGSNHLDDVAASQVLATLSRERQDNHAIASSSSTTDPPPVAALGPNNPVRNGVDQDGDRPEEEGSVFLGESTSIRYVHNDVETPSDSQSKHFLHRVPWPVRESNHVPLWEEERRAARLNALRAEGAFSFPEPIVVECLVGAYFQWSHSCFAILDQPSFLRVYRKGSISPLLLNAVLFMSVFHISDEELHRMGLVGRERAKYTFYNRAKDIYDVDHERDKLAVVQSLFLLSFWRAGPHAEKDVRYWLGAAITQAQTRAFHRSTSTSDPRLERIKRRIWWSLYVRERQCAAALGLPNRIRDEDCDVSALQRKDFEAAFGEEVPSWKIEEYTNYQIGMVELARVLGQIMLSGYLPGREFGTAQKAAIIKRLTEWKSEVPANVCLAADGPSSLHISMLHLAYNNLLILLHRAEFLKQHSDIPRNASDGSIDHQDGTVSLALQAAARNSRIIEDMLVGNNTLRHAQVHVITNIFNTLCIHTVHLRHSNSNENRNHADNSAHAGQGIAVTIAEQRAKICLLGLQELQRTWEVQNWILQLFFHYLDRSTASRLLPGSNTGGGKSNPRSRAPTRRNSLSRGGQASQAAASEPNNSDSELPFDTHIDGTTEDGSLLQYQRQLDSAATADTPWSWSTEEQNHFLFSQIQNNVSFGEGAILDWGGDETFAAALGQFGSPLTDSFMGWVPPLGDNTGV